MIVMAIHNVTAGVSTQLLFMTYRSSLTDPLTYVRFFTHVLGHGDWNHLIGNMSYILLLGPLLEEKYGSGSIMEVIALTALSTGIINFIFFPNAALLGASGICFAFIVLSSLTSFKNREIPLTFLLVAVIFLGQQVYDGIFHQDNISNMAHIVGGIVGAVAGFVTGGRRR
jgi:GlpG protein